MNKAKPTWEEMKTWTPEQISESLRETLGPIEFAHHEGFRDGWLAAEREYNG